MVELSYLGFLLANSRYLGFGFLLAFVSSFGQTFFIGLYKGELLAEFDSLTHASYGGWYSVATLSSAACLMYLGRRVDHVDLRWFSLFVGAGLCGACFLMSVTSSVLLLVVALFGLRLFGQGLMSHIANTATARYFDRERGRALSFVNLGHPAGEAVLPLAVAALLTQVEWRSCWQIQAAVVLLFVVPIVLILLRGHARRHEELLASLEKGASRGDGRQWTAREVLRDPRFYLLLPAVLAPAFLTTGLLFHQDVLRSDMGWSKPLFASSFMAYSLAQVSTAPIAGILVDRFGARRMLPVYLVPYGFALFLISRFEGDGWAFAFMAGAGMSSGLAFSAVGSLWAELYGVLHLGAIRTQASVAMVVSTALSPPLVGALIDRGFAMTSVALFFCVYTGISSLMLVLGLRRDPPAL